MRRLKLLALVAVLPAILAGCASSGDSTHTRDNSLWCVVGGAVAGAAAGALADGGVGAAVVGAGAGAVLGEVACAHGHGSSQDSDGDGVPDSLDACPDTPAAAHGAVDAKGCPLYSDGDDVPDYLDDCPDTPSGVATDDRGCPIADSDGDGVDDSRDNCPDTPAGAVVDANGCSVSGEKLAIITNVNFGFDKAEIRPDAAAKLDRVVSTLRANPDINVRVVGHTDSVGAAAYNQQLSERRAASVMQYMTSQGIDASRMTSAGRGESEPLVDNGSKAGRAVNRRVEFEVM